MFLNTTVSPRKMFSKFRRLVRRAEKLSERIPIMPIDEIRLAVEFSELPNQPLVISRLIDELFDHDDMHVRRIAVNACRHSEHFDAPGLREALLDRLEDEEGWVRYDAAWTIGDGGYDDDEIRDALSVAARDATLPDDEILRQEDASNSDLSAKVRALEVLNALKGITPTEPSEG